MKMSSVRCCTWMIVPLALFGFTVHAPSAAADGPNGRGLDRLPLSAESVTSVTVRPVRTSVKWYGQEYDVDAAIDVLMNVVRDPETSRHDRELALIHLTMAGTHLKARPYLRELETLYDKAEKLEKLIILDCFLGSRDPCGIPMFTRTLDNEQDVKLRLSAASGLAGWNIRRGVAELVDLLESEEKLEQPARTASVRDNALGSFRNANSRKGWAFPKNEWWKSIDGRADLDEDQKRGLYNEEIEKEIRAIKKWFPENEHRFPDWKPGDPLPTNSEGDNDDASKR